MEKTKICVVEESKLRNILPGDCVSITHCGPDNKVTKIPENIVRDINKLSWEDVQMGWGVPDSYTISLIDKNGDIRMLSSQTSISFIADIEIHFSPLRLKEKSRCETCYNHRCLGCQGMWVEDLVPKVGDISILPEGDTVIVTGLVQGKLMNYKTELNVLTTREAYEWAISQSALGDTSELLRSLGIFLRRISSSSSSDFLVDSMDILKYIKRWR